MASLRTIGPSCSPSDAIIPQLSQGVGPPIQETVVHERSHRVGSGPGTDSCVGNPEPRPSHLGPEKDRENCEGVESDV